MTIQLPVVLWTIICFIVLMIVLKFLLFNPILKLMDDRKAKILKAQQKLEAEKILIEEHNQKLQVLEEEQKEQEKAYIKSEIEKIRTENKKALEEAKAQRLSTVEQYKSETEKEKEETIAVFNASAGAIAKAFADRIISFK